MSLDICISTKTLPEALKLNNHSIHKKMSALPEFTAYKGFEALFNSMGGYISGEANPVSDMFEIAAIENIGRNLTKVVQDICNIDSNKKVTYGKTLSEVVMHGENASSLHYLVYVMSKVHRELPNGAGMIMLSRAYFTHLINKHVCDDKFVKMAKAMGMEEASEPVDFITILLRLQKDCGVEELKMSDYNIKPKEFEIMAKTAKDFFTPVFISDRCEFSLKECIKIYQDSYK